MKRKNGQTMPGISHPLKEQIALLHFNKCILNKCICITICSWTCIYKKNVHAHYISNFNVTLSWVYVLIRSCVKVYLITRLWIVMQISWCVWNIFDTSSHNSYCSGDTLFQMAEVHRQIQVQLEDVVSKRDCIVGAKLYSFSIALCNLSMLILTTITQFLLSASQIHILDALLVFQLLTHNVFACHSFWKLSLKQQKHASNLSVWLINTCAKHNTVLYVTHTSNRN